jgi:hypothetical protein
VENQDLQELLAAIQQLCPALVAEYGDGQIWEVQRGSASLREFASQSLALPFVDITEIAIPS